jgi:hypothetical protein
MCPWSVWAHAASIGTSPALDEFSKMGRPVTVDGLAACMAASTNFQ